MVGTSIIDAQSESVQWTALLIMIMVTKSTKRLAFNSLAIEQRSDTPFLGIAASLGIYRYTQRALHLTQL